MLPLHELARLVVLCIRSTKGHLQAHPTRRRGTGHAPQHPNRRLAPPPTAGFVARDLHLRSAPKAALITSDRVVIVSASRQVDTRPSGAALTTTVTSTPARSAERDWTHSDASPGHPAARAAVRVTLKARAARRASSASLTNAPKIQPERRRRVRLSNRIQSSRPGSSSASSNVRRGECDRLGEEGIRAFTSLSLSLVHLRPALSSIGTLRTGVPLRAAGGIPRTRVGRPRKRVRVHALRGFKSHRYRH